MSEQRTDAQGTIAVERGVTEADFRRRSPQAQMRRRVEFAPALERGKPKRRWIESGRKDWAPAATRRRRPSTRMIETHARRFEQTHDLNRRLLLGRGLEHLLGGEAPQPGERFAEPHLRQHLIQTGQTTDQLPPSLDGLIFLAVERALARPAQDMQQLQQARPRARR